VVSLAAALPLFFLFRILIINYRAHLLAWVRKSHMMQVLKASKLFRLYQATSNVREMV
jgi:hypothetical protein